MGQTIVWILAVITSFAAISMQASTPQSDSYVAAVVEYAPVSGATLENKDEIFMQNVANYTRFMEEAAMQDADIIVFPEIGLASMGVPLNPDGTPSLAFYVPAPGANPCDDISPDIAQGLKDLSCAARRHRLYAVVNLPERVNCNAPGLPASDADQCSSSGAVYHNTNVVFDRGGNIVARYRKFNLFGEAGFVPTPQPEYAIFETDFGVRFATFICFDIMFEEPSVVLARNHSVCDFAFSTAWFSEAPFLTAVQTQAAWAYSLDVNLLASGYNKPIVGSAGSGIFLGRNGTRQSIMPTSITSRILVGTVPKVRRCKGSFVVKARSRRVPAIGEADAAEDEEYENTGVARTPVFASRHDDRPACLEAPTLASNKQPTETAGNLKRPIVCRKQAGSNSRCVKTDEHQRKCKLGNEEQKPSTYTELREKRSLGGTDTVRTDVRPNVGASEQLPGGVNTEAKSQKNSSKGGVSTEPSSPGEGGGRSESDALVEGIGSTITAGLYLKRDHLDVYKTVSLNTVSPLENRTVLLCDGSFCCNFTVVTEVNAKEGQPRYIYRLAVFDGVRTFDGVTTGGVQVCGVIPCAGDDIASCGRLTLPDAAAATTVFRSISISGLFSSNHTLITANTLAPGLAALPADRYDTSVVPQEGGVARVTMGTSDVVRQDGLTLLTFAIYSRVFNRDGEPETTPPQTIYM